MTTTISQQTHQVLPVHGNPLSEQADVILKHRYLLKDSKGEFVENSDYLFRRVAKAIASIE